MPTLSYNPQKEIPDQSGRVFLITGGTAGIGAQAIEHLAAHNPGHIYFTGRNKDAADKLITRVKSKHDVKVTFIECDLKDLSSVKRAATTFRESSQRLDVLMCNAGIMALGTELTKDNYEVQFQVNHLSQALLVKLLLPVLQHTAQTINPDVRIITLTSTAQNLSPASGIQFDTLNTTQDGLGGLIGPGGKWTRYGQSKLANLLYPQYLATQHPEIRSVAVHPGVIRTDLFGNMSLSAKIGGYMTTLGKAIPVEQGPYNQLWAATAPVDKVKSGEYYMPVGKVGRRDYKASGDKELATRLGEWTDRALEQYL